MSLKGVTEDLFLGRLFSLLEPPERISTRDYAEKYRWLSSDVSAKPGKMNCMLTPWMLFFMECLDNEAIKIIVGKKSAQIAWSETQNSWISMLIDTDPQNIIMAFPRAASADAYVKEKIRPMITANERLVDKIGDPNKCSISFFKYPGGFLKTVTAGSPNALKSTAAPKLIVEEPSDLQDDVKSQGAALEIFAERQKTFEERKLVYGGTPTQEGFCKVHEAFEKSNKMFYFVTCEKCNEEHHMIFENLICEKWADGRVDKLYGLFNPETAYYRCPNCSDKWDDKKKQRAVMSAIEYNNLGWKATAKSEIYGFAFNELLSSFPGSGLKDLAAKKLAAEVEADKGKDGKLISFTNNSMGLVYSPKTLNTSVEGLKALRKDYPEMVVPGGGIILTMGVDVQHDRFAVIIRAWGRNGNSWLVYWGELYGYVKDPEDAVWGALTELYLKRIPHAFSSDEHPVGLPISACSIDSGDGNTVQLVYSWVKKLSKHNKYTFATKGSSDVGVHKKEIFTVPTDPDTESFKGKRKKVAETMGVNVYIVGTQLGKDEVLRKLTLTGAKDRSYHYQTCRSDYEDQLLSNRKKISANSDRVRYELVFGKRDEVLDCELLALHSSRALHLHLWTDKHWEQAEKPILQQTILTKKTAVPNITPGIN